MKRRLLLALAGAWTGAAQAQQRLPLIGVLSLRTPEGNAENMKAFMRGLATLGFEENRNVAIAYTAASGDIERLKAAAAELLRRQPAVLFAVSSNAGVVAKAATGTVPIVYVGASDPVKLGLVQSLARPGGNVTGVTMFSHTFGAKRLELLHELMPQATSIGILINPANPSADEERQDLRRAAATLGLQPMFVEARSDAELETAFARLGEAKVRALYMVDDPLFASRDARLCALALQGSIGMVSTLHSFSTAGALASYGTDYAQIHYDAALYVARILRGEKPADLPVLLPTRFTLTLNQKTARALGLTLSPSLLARADEVIE
jgi:putative ABC transport system substrate-binding protein